MHTSTTLQLQISPAQIIAAVQAMNKAEQQDFLEDLLAATSPEYLSSIQEARAEYRAGKTQSHDEVFG
jgi:hypothetical protein